MLTRKLEMQMKTLFSLKSSAKMGISWKKNLICIGCPMGCPLTVKMEHGEVALSVTGNTCKRGDIYARKK